MLQYSPLFVYAPRINGITGRVLSKRGWFVPNLHWLCIDTVLPTQMTHQKICYAFLPVQWAQNLHPSRMVYQHSRLHRIHQLWNRWFTQPRDFSTEYLSNPVRLPYRIALFKLCGNPTAHCGTCFRNIQKKYISKYAKICLFIQTDIRFFDWCFLVSFFVSK